MFKRSLRVFKKFVLASFTFFHIVGNFNIINRLNNMKTKL